MLLSQAIREFFITFLIKGGVGLWFVPIPAFRSFPCGLRWGICPMGVISPILSDPLAIESKSWRCAPGLKWNWFRSQVRRVNWSALNQFHHWLKSSRECSRANLKQWSSRHLHTKVIAKYRIKNKKCYSETIFIMYIFANFIYFLK